jgi:hypothetical protein
MQQKDGAGNISKGDHIDIDKLPAKECLDNAANRLSHLFGRQQPY